MAIDENTLRSLVDFHKTLADATRLKLVGLLALRPMCGLELAEQLKVSAPTVSHHISKLKELDLVRSVRENNTIYYSLDVDRLHKLQRGTLGELAVEDTRATPVGPRGERQRVMHTFFEGPRLRGMPAQHKRQLYILEVFAGDFEPGRDYPERAVDEIIERRYDDYCLIRRNLIIHGYMTRDRNVYRLLPRDRWPRPDEL